MIEIYLQVAGLALLVIGVLLKTNNVEGIKFDDVSLDLAPVALIVLGSIIFIIAFFGCCGAIRESTCMLTSVKKSFSAVFEQDTSFTSYNLPEKLQFEKKKKLKKVFS